MQQTNPHQPVLLDETLEYLAPKSGESYLDLTAGYGGHASAVLAATKQPKLAVLVDRDANAIEFLSKKFKGQGITLVHSDFYLAAQALKEQGRHFDVILADLGTASVHFDDASRGFSIAREGPLDMRFDQNQELTAAGVVNSYSQPQLERLIRSYGEEPRARRISEAIVSNRPFNTTTELAELIAKTLGRGSRIHPATRTFQAIRIEVNQELDLLKKSLTIWIDLLNPSGRLALISFHSLEDRLVKQTFEEFGGDRYDADLKILTKKPIMGGKNEIVFNPRARSAKLRAVAKIKI